ncbi:MAG: hypothetical protein ACK2TU_02350 [Anaerolineales bacterium]|jgi:hypothetical protein
MPEANSSDLDKEIQTMTMNLNKVTTSLDNADELIDVYQVSVNKTINQLKAIRQNVLIWISTFSVLITVILVCLALAQVGLLFQGFDIVRKH